MFMLKIENGSCSASELKAVAALFYKKLSADPVFRAAFPDPAVGRAHCAEFVDAYAKKGEIHRVMEDGMLAAAALWSLPGQAVPSPTWDFSPGRALLQALPYGIPPPRRGFCAAGLCRPTFFRAGYRDALRHRAAVRLFSPQRV